MSNRPIAYIMKQPVSELDVEDIKAAIAHINRMLEAFQEQRRIFEAEFRARLEDPKA